MSVDEFARTGNRAGSSHAGGPVALPSVTAGVALWWSDLAHEPEDVAPVASWLSADEHARAARFGTDALRRRYIAGRATLRLLLGRTLGIDPAAVEVRRGVRGRPELADRAIALDFNVSHTRGGAVVGIAHGLPRHARIGVDVEREDRTLAADGLARKFLSAEEQSTLPGVDADGRRRRFLRYWTCKEAMSKATGDGLGAPFAQLTVGIGSNLELVAGPAPYDPPSWRLHAVAVPDGFIATLALWRGDEALSVPARR